MLLQGGIRFSQGGLHVIGQILGGNAGTGFVVFVTPGRLLGIGDEAVG